MGGAAAVVRAYLPADGRELARAEEADVRLACAGLPPAQRRLVDEGDWADAWKRFFRVQHVGVVVIRPSWRRYRPRAGETIVDLDPGMAFGTGQHPTTRMCLRALQTAMRPGGRVLDVGTGSGILAIAAARLGASEVLALDTEPLAVRVATGNAEANGVAPRVRVLRGTLDGAIASRRFDLVLANINAAAILSLATLLARATARDGTLVCSGLLEDGARSVAAVLRSQGMAVRRTRRGGDWRTLESGWPG